MAKVIFIEPLNVLNTKSYQRRLRDLNKGRSSSVYEESFDPTKINMLLEIMSLTDAQIMICSEWRCCPEKMSILMDNFQKVGITPDSGIFGIMSIQEKGLTKNESLSRFLSMRDRLGIEKYVIIDSKLNEDYLDLPNTFHTTQLDEGLTEDIKSLIISYFGLSDLKLRK